MLLRDPEAAAYVGKSPSWLQHSRQTGDGPPYLKIGTSVRYRSEDLDAWLQSQVRRKVWQFDVGAAS
jgi:predicted DNA-binding transcriptional regulator AlpA